MALVPTFYRYLESTIALPSPIVLTVVSASSCSEPFWFLVTDFDAFSILNSASSSLKKALISVSLRIVVKKRTLVLTRSI